MRTRIRLRQTASNNSSNNNDNNGTTQQRIVSTANSNLIELGDRKFHFDSVTTGNLPNLSSYPDFTAGKSFGLVSIGLNSLVSASAERYRWMIQILERLKSDVEAAVADPNFTSQLSFGFIGLSDHRVIDLISEKTIPAMRLRNGMPESMFQTVQDFNEILRTVDQNINSCGVIIMLKLERIPTRLGMSLDKAIDEERSTYRALSNWTPSDGSRLAVPSVSHLILADLGDVWLNTKNVPQHIPSLSQSVAILCKAIEGGNFDFSNFGERHVLCSLLRKMFSGGGSIDGTVLIDMEDTVMGNETASALEFGQMLRLIRNNSGVSQFDERVAILWRLEKRYKQLKSMFEEQSDVLAETKNTFDQLNNAYKALQVAYTELQTLAEENRESFESGQKQMIEQIGVYQQKLQKLQDSHSQEMVELTAAYEKENREADSRVQKIKAEYESLTEQQAKSSDMKLKEMKSSLSASFETSHSKAESTWLQEKLELKEQMAAIKRELEVSQREMKRERDEWEAEKQKLEESVSQSTKQKDSDKQLALLKKEKEELIGRVAKAEMELDIVKAQLNGLSKQAAAVENSRTNVNDDCEAESVVQQQQPQQPKQTVKQKRNRVKNVAGPKPKGTRPPPKQDSSDNEEQSAVSEDERENRKSNSKSTRKRKAAAATARKVYKENRDDDDEKQSDSDKQERDVEEQPKQKRKLFKGNSQENLSAGLDRKNMTIPIGSLINPEAFQKIRNNFSLPKQ